MKILSVFAMTTADKFALSGEMMLKGMGTVFMVLVLLWGILALFSVIFGTQAKKPADEEKTASAQQKPKTVQASETVSQKPASAAPASNDGALIAAITAAVEAYRAEEGNASLPFRVVSFKRKTGSSGWNGSSAE